MRFWPFSKKKKQPEPAAQADQTLDWRDDRLYDELMRISGVRSSAGPVISAATAMKFSAVYGCVSLLSGTIASLPCEVFKRDGKRGVSEPGHPVYRLLHDEPDPRYSAYIFWETTGYYHFLEGNSYGLIGRYPDGAPRSISLLPAWNVTPRFSPDKTRIWYSVILEDGTRKTYDQGDILHFPCIGWDGLRGMSPISAAREAIGLGLSGEDYNAKYFTNGITSDIVISFKERGPQGDAKVRFKEYIKERYTGPENLRTPLVLTDGGEAKSLTMSAEDAQLIASRDFQIEDIARFYQVPLHLISSTSKTTSWGTGIEQQTLGFLKFTLRRRLKMMEQELNRKLIRHPAYYCKFNLDALLRADTKTRYEGHKIALGGTQSPGFMTPNETREIEGLPPRPDGDKLYSPKPGKDTDTGGKEGNGNADSGQ